MYHFSRISKERLSTCHPDLQKLFNEVIKNFDCSIIEGHRSEEKQKKLLTQGLTKTLKSKHLNNPSLAVDVVPFPVKWEEEATFYYFAGYVKGIANQLGIKIRSGADWNQNNNCNDQTFNDLVHFELCGKN